MTIEERISQLEMQLSGGILNPLFDKVIGSKINIHYTTIIPTYKPNENGVREIYFDSTNYWLYIYANGAWRKVQLT